MKRINVFAYGLLLDHKLMSSFRDVKKIGAGILNDWKFSLRGYADVQPELDEKVVGGVWEIWDWQLTQLDRIEGYPRMYDRKTVNISLLQGEQTVEAFVYTMTPKTIATLFGAAGYASPYYVERILDGLKDFNVPDELVNTILTDFVPMFR